MLELAIRAYRRIPWRPRCRCGGPLSCSELGLLLAQAHGMAALGSVLLLLKCGKRDLYGQDSAAEQANARRGGENPLRVVPPGYKLAKNYVTSGKVVCTSCGAEYGKPHLRRCQTAPVIRSEPRGTPRARPQRVKCPGCHKMVGDGAPHARRCPRMRSRT